jgi:hypothetical protein
MSNAGFLEWVFTVFAGCFIAFLISLVPLGIAYGIGAIPKRKGVMCEEFELISLKEKDGITGRFFLGTGFIEGIEYYFWYRKNENGSISGGKTQRQEGVEIYEKDETPKMITFETDYTNKYVKYFIWIIGIDRRGDVSWCPRFIIPKGSIKEGYTL